MATSLAVARLGNFLTTRYAQFLDLSDVAASMTGREDVEKSRALAAHCISRLGRLDPDDATTYVTDGFNDLGIDALYYDRAGKMLYVVQSKWSNNGSRKISETDAIKTITGLRSVLSVDLSAANDRLRRFCSDCEDAANDNETRYTVVFATTANESLSDHARQYVSKEIERIGGLSGLVLCEEFSRSRLYDTLTAASEPNKICLTVELEEWGEVSSPLPAYYGRVSLATVLEWHKFGFTLFHKNVRGFLDDQELLASLSGTLDDCPENFWYFNNGATLLCDQVKKRPIHGNDRRKGIFDLCGVSVVNGAQTIGVIWRFLKDGAALDPLTRLPLRFISLQGASPDFATQVTRALNTQRKIESRDFVALDPVQHRLRRDMALDGRTYILKSGETATGHEASHCTFTEAAVSLACAHGDVDLAARAKRVVSELWASTSTSPYTDLFPHTIDAETVWRAVIIYRSIQSAIKDLRDRSAGRNKTILSHGNRFIAYKVFRVPAVRGFRNPNERLDDLQEAASLSTAQIAQRICEVLNGHWRDETVQYLFKYPQKCRELDVLTADNAPSPVSRSVQKNFLPA